MKIYSNFIEDICELVNKNKRLGVFLKNISFYGVHKYSEENVYQVTLADDKKEIVIYVEEDAFKYWGEVPWSGQSKFRPTDFDDWPNERKLILAWCWAIYKYCKHGTLTSPPEILK